MDPYIHAAGGRGEGFRVDDIDDLDQFAWQQTQIKTALEKTPKRKKVRTRILKLIKDSFAKLPTKN